MENIDIGVVAAYGLIIPQEVLIQPKFGFINIHYSLLPKYRGASPVQTAIVNGEKITGTTIMRVDKELDHGEIIQQKEVIIGVNDTAEILLNRLNETSLPLLDFTLRTVGTGTFPPITPQDHTVATFTRKLTKDDGFIEFDHLKNALKGSLNSAEIHNIIRGFYPWPGAWTTLPNWKRLKLLSSEIKENKLILKEIQLEGKQKTTDLNFLTEFLH
jgi:methionyl-tRNA formyltransferase